MHVCTKVAAQTGGPPMPHHLTPDPKGHAQFISSSVVSTAAAGVEHLRREKGSGSREREGGLPGQMLYIYIYI